MPSLPTPGGSSDTWGTELNNWLLVGHDASGNNLGASLAELLGWGGFTSHPSTCSDTFSHTSGQLRGTAIAFSNGDLVTGLAFICAEIATSPTLCRLGLYKASDMSLLASTANDTSLVGTTGMREKNLSSPYTFTSDTLAYIAILTVGAAGGSLVGYISDSSAHRGRSGHPVSAVRQQSLSDLPNPIVNDVGFGATPWVGWY
jgi:hypothetical protein